MITSKTLTSAAAPFGLPLVGLEDIQADVRMLHRIRRDKPACQFLWIVKSCGSVLFPIGQGVNPHFATFCFDSQHQAFLIKGEGVFAIETEEAQQLAYQYPFDIEQIFTQDMLIAKVSKLLSRAQVHSSAVADCELTVDSSWGAWKRWFEASNHPVMAAFMDICIKRSVRLAEIWQ